VNTNIRTDLPTGDTVYYTDNMDTNIVIDLIYLQIQEEEERRKKKKERRKSKS
jgi:hypothetical protein